MASNVDKCYLVSSVEKEGNQQIDRMTTVYIKHVYSVPYIPGVG